MSVDAAFSKKHVNRCGKAVRDSVRSPGEIGDDDEAAWSQLLEAVDVIDWWRAQHAKPLARVNAGLRYYVRKAGATQQNVTQRLKRFATIVDKLDRHPRMALTTMEDIGGVRVVLDTQRQVDFVVTQLRHQPRWTLRRVREYIEGRDPGPRSDGYRAVHVVVERDGHFIEVQVRTPWQDVWAQSVEEDTRRLRAGLKFGQGPADLREYYVMTSEFFAMRERGEEPSQEFMAALAKLFRATRKYFPDEARGGGA
jgi:putative GTP pyrophosphokinase